MINDLQAKVMDLVGFIQACVTGEPLVAGSWFEYENVDLDINSVENHVLWLLPEVVPHIKKHVAADLKSIRDLFGGFFKLSPEVRSRLTRSMERFSLSQSRQKIVDQVLDLALAFEIAVSGGRGDNAPPNWKVGTRTAQLIGGPLLDRQTTRSSLGALYRLRNIATHGGNFSDPEKREQKEILASAYTIYRRLVESFIVLASVPDWPSLELEPRVKK
jgi:hypothetical protein